jgi:predicted NBD/HSP70 family sugar kinase
MADQTLVRYVNERGVLTILRTQGSMSRADLARKLSLTPATITRLVTDLGQRDLVREIDSAVAATAREPGRPGVGLALNGPAAFFLGVEIGVGIIRFAVIDLAATVVSSSETSIARTLTPAKAVAIIAERIGAYQDDPRFKGRLRAAGATVPGLVTSEGFVVYLPMMGWKSVNLLGLLRAATDLPFFVENNAKAAAFGSIYTMPTLPSVCTIFLKLGTGCGGAAIINGRLLRGATGTAGEFGHLRISAEGHRCSCGQNGCLESWVNLGAMARLFKGTDRLTRREFARLPDVMAKAAEDGDAAALAAIDSLAHYLTLGLVTLINTFNPTTIMLGGVMRPLLERCLAAVRSAVARSVIPGTSIPDVRLSHLGVIECAVGAATIAHHNAFDVSTIGI